MMILSKSTLTLIIEELKSLGKIIVFTNGCFDILHAGHCKYLHETRKLGDVLIVGLNSDDSVRRLKGSDRPINNCSDRALILSSLKDVDYVCVFEEDTPYELLSSLKPNILVKGGDYNEDHIIGADIVKSIGGKVVVIDLLEGRSTSNLISKIKEK